MDFDNIRSTCAQEDKIVEEQLADASAVSPEEGCAAVIDESIDKTEKCKANSDISRQVIRKDILRFAWPCMTELLLSSMLSMISLMMVGRLGSYAISAVSITNQPIFLLLSVFFAFNIGATALVARFIGSKDREGAKRVMIQAMVIAVGLGAILAVVGFFAARWAVVAMGAEADTVYYAEIYMKYMAIGIPFQSIPIAVSSLLRGAGETKAPMRFNIVTNVVNVATGFALIYGFSFLPAMGVGGAGLAATISKIVGCGMSIYFLFNKKMPIFLTFKTLKQQWHLDMDIMKRIMNVGYASAGEQLVLRVGLLVFTKLMAGLGTAPFAVHNICMNILSLSFNIGQALGMTATSFMGRSLGAREPDKAEMYGKECRRIGMALSIVVSIAFFFGGRGIAALYSSEAAVIASSVLILKIVAIIVPAQNSQLIISGGLRGAGDTKWPLIATMSGILGFRMIVGFLFINVFKWGLIGGWAAITLDQYVRSLVIFLRFRTGKWKYIRV